MNCKDFKNRIEMEFKQGGLELPSDMKAHLESCSDCAAYYAELKSLELLLGRETFAVRPGELDDITFEKIVAQAEGHKEKATVFVNIFQLKWVWIPAAAAAIIIAVLFVPQMIHKPSVNPATAVTDYYLPVDIDLEKALTSSDTLTDEFLSTMAGNSGEFDVANDELTNDSDIDDIINGLTNTEVEALYNKIENLKG